MLYRAVFRLVLIILLLIVALSVFAQDDGWEVALFDGTEIVIVTADGITEHISPPELSHYRLAIGRGFRATALSPDKHYFAFVAEGAAATPDGFSGLKLLIADLEQQSCCVEVENPLPAEPEYISVGLFSPDSRLLSASFNRPYYEPTADLIGVFDVAGGALTASFDPVAELSANGTSESMNTVFMDAWDDNGITLRPVCIPCDGYSILTGYLHIWNPQTNTVTETSAYFSYFGERLQGTGEFVAAAQNADFPANDSDGRYGPDPHNVIELMVEDGSTGVIYHDPGAPPLPMPHWINDGQAFLLYWWGDDSAVVNMRDGTYQQIQLGGIMRFLTGTPDGWLMQSVETGTLIHYRFSGDEVVSETLASYDSDLTVLNQPELGGSIQTPFIPISR